MPTITVETLRGLTTLALQLANTVFWGMPLYLVTLFKALARGDRARRASGQALIAITQGWVDGVLRIFELTQDLHWDIRGNVKLSPTQSYLLVANHQSWVDIIAVFQALNRRMPFPRFFAKRELVWLPIVGQALWALDFPLLKRHSAEAVARHPELKGEDLETTRKACEKYRHIPVTLINFLEGSRFTPEKHEQRRSPYRNLLPPKTGGVALALESMAGQIDTIVDVTIAYPDSTPNFWDLLSGRVKQVVVVVEPRPVPPTLLDSSFHSDIRARTRLREWLEDIWQEKDRTLDQLQ